MPFQRTPRRSPPRAPRDDEGHATAAHGPALRQPSASPTASTSTLPTPSSPRPTIRTRRKLNSGGDGGCWCHSRDASAAGLSKRSRTRRRLRLEALAATVALAHIPSAHASPSPSPAPGALRAARSFPAPTPAPLVKRAAVEQPLPIHFTQSNGVWVPSDEWELQGRRGSGYKVVEYEEAEIPGAPEATAIEDNLDILLPSSSDSSVPTSTVVTSSASSTYSPANSGTLSATFSLPSGWAPTTRSTGFYAVPVIIATSVILAVIVIGAIIGSVIWRRKVRRRAKREQDPEKAAKSGGRRRKKKKRGQNGKGGLRRRRAQEDGGDDDAATALTGSIAGGIAPPTLTRRLASRIRRSRPPSPTPPAAPASLFRTASAASAASALTTPSHLTRTSSQHSVASRHSVAQPHEDVLGQPADHSAFRATSPTLSLSYPDVVLPAPGPPAYRPAGATIQHTLRLSESRPPSANLASSSTSPTSGPDNDDQTGWHWPGEKSSPSARNGVRRVPPPRIELDLEPPPASAGEEEREAPDPSTYRAHVATDDKAVLARLRAQAESIASGSGSSERVQASAPSVNDDEVDEDGFERSDAMPSAQDVGEGSSGATGGCLPPPPERIVPSFSFGSEREDESFLPVYVPRSAIEDAMATASAPPPEEDEEGEQDLEYVARGDEDSGVGERQLHGVV